MSITTGVYAAIRNTSLVVTESGGSLYVCVEIIGVLETQVTVTIETTDGSAEGTVELSYSYSTIWLLLTLYHRK